MYDAGSEVIYGYVGGNPISRIDPFGLEDVAVGAGYTGRVDQFNYQGQSSFEIHVFDPQGEEVGIYGPEGWISKHGFNGKPANLPAQVENSCKGIAVDKGRKSGRIPEKGRANIKGPKWLRYFKWLPLIDVGLEETRPSVDRVCELDPSNAAC